MATALLNSHLDQIQACAASIAELEFIRPRMFTNALLAPHDITSLIRDTEVHERALFSIAPPTLGGSSSVNQSFATEHRRATIAPASLAARTAKRNTAVAAVLGRDLYRRVRTADGDESLQTSSETGRGAARPRARGEVDVEILLEGATKLSSTYPIPGVAEEVARLRARYQQLAANIAHYEDRVERNARQLEGMSHVGIEDREEEVEEGDGDGVMQHMTREDLERDEREIAELERKKRGLESRVTEMEKDLGGLLR